MLLEEILGTRYHERFLMRKVTGESIAVTSNEQDSRGIYGRMVRSTHHAHLPNAAGRALDLRCERGSRTAQRITMARAGTVLALVTRSFVFLVTLAQTNCPHPRLCVVPNWIADMVRTPHSVFLYFPWVLCFKGLAPLFSAHLDPVAVSYCQCDHRATQATRDAVPQEQS
jgi:hypothetical protein